MCNIIECFWFKLEKMVLKYIYDNFMFCVLSGDC